MKLPWRRKVTQRDINEFIALGGDTSLLSAEQLEEDISPTKLYPISASRRKLIEHSQRQGKDERDYYYKHFYDNWDMEPIEISRQAEVNKIAALGGNLLGIYEFSRERIEAIPQCIVNWRVANGGGTIVLSGEQKDAVPQECINERAANGGSLEDFWIDRRKAIPSNNSSRKGYTNYPYDTPPYLLPQSEVNQFARRGGFMAYFSEEQIAAVPQECINERATNGGDMWVFSKEQIAAIPQECINERAANGGSLKSFSDTQRKDIPQEIITPTENAKSAIILYSVGKMDSKDLPLDVFVNYRARKALLEIVKNKTINEFKNICETKGYVKDVPDEIKDAFDQKLQNIESEIQGLKKKGLDKLFSEMDKRKAEAEEKAARTIEQVSQMRW